MSGKLDQSLDEIMKDRKPASGAGRRPARKATAKSKAATTTVVAPTGGVQKKGSGRGAAAPSKTATAVLAAVGGESKIAVSGLPLDVREADIKAYFTQAAETPVKRVILNYGPNSTSRGSATVIFVKSDGAAKAAKCDGTRVDGKTLRVEILVGAKNVAKPPTKSLAERASKPKNTTQNKPKSAAAKPTVNGDANDAAKNRPDRASKKKSGRAGKPKAKTTEELDAEMQDYFGSGQTNGAAAPAGGETMDEVL